MGVRAVAALVAMLATGVCAGLLGIACVGCRGAGRARLTPGPMAASLELVRRDYPFLPGEPECPAAPPGRVKAAPAGPEEHPYPVPPREAQQVVFVADSWLVVTRVSASGKEKLVAFDADWSHSRAVSGLPEQRDGNYYLVLVPDPERRKTLVLTNYMSDPERGRARVALLDIAHARVDTLFRATGCALSAVWAGERVVAVYEPDDGANVLVLIDPATRAVRELYREPPQAAGALIGRLWPSPGGSRVALDRTPTYTSANPTSRSRKRGIVVVDIATGRSGPVANDPRRSYYHATVEWENEDSLLFAIGEGGSTSLYRARLRPAGRTSHQ
jgi:hypothetical protein